MTYTAENIRNIKASGKFDEYVAMERGLLASLKGAEIIETEGEHTSGTMALAHLRGEYSAWMREGADGKMIYESSVFCRHGKTETSEPLSREWSNFPSLNAAKQYARAALRNHLKEVAADVANSTRGNLASLGS